MKGCKMSFDRNKLKDIKFRHHNTLLYAKELFNAIDEFYKTEDEYEYFVKVDGRERGIVFRIAHILANRLEKKYNVYVDCEANRCNGDHGRELCQLPYPSKNCEFSCTQPICNAFQLCYRTFGWSGNHSCNRSGNNGPVCRRPSVRVQNTLHILQYNQNGGVHIYCNLVGIIFWILC